MSEPRPKARIAALMMALTSKKLLGHLQKRDPRELARARRHRSTHRVAGRFVRDQAVDSSASPTGCGANACSGRRCGMKSPATMPMVSATAQRANAPV